ncbi:MAG: ATP-dependent DNA helicase RecG [Catonella sp.]|nr:ATP-dependent DNA helicase RecG [Catonella sp.]
MALTDDIRKIKGVGEKTAALFNKLGIFTKNDLLLYFPRDYDTYAKPSPISGLKENEKEVIYAAPTNRPELITRGGKQIVVCKVSDGTGEMELLWFGAPYVRTKLYPGSHLYFKGTVTRRGNSLTMVQPELLGVNEYRIKSQTLQPVYHLTKGLTVNTLRKCVKAALMDLTAGDDYLPQKIKDENDFEGLRDAVSEIHFPKSRETMMDARRRLVFDEFFLFALSVKMMKDDEEVEKFPNELHDVDEVKSYIAGLPYDLTGAQKRALTEIRNDLLSGKRMNRLIQGDVGSGKTVIAIISCLFMAKNGFESVMMAPTEVLAKQHFETFKSALLDFDINVALLTGSMKASEKKKTREKISNHEVDIIIGTHALITDSVEYNRLGLVITDEQHRFGVKQREKLRNKGENAHTLVMSATPIPRTLAVVMYGDLDVSLIDELPAERLPIKNAVVDKRYRPKSWEFIKKEAETGHQAYVICPMIERSNEEDPLADVLSYEKELAGYLGKDIKTTFLHGKMREEEKASVMESFAKGETKVLVSTTVVEVGVNVPNATVMLIENAERFGLASLHQLRGRIGRGSAQSYCIFMAGKDSPEVMERLSILGKSNDGFKIAEEDMAMRGAGDIFGIRQSGDMVFKLGDIMNDAKILKLAGDTVKNSDDKTLSLCYDRGKRFYGRCFSYGGEADVL